LRSWTKAEKDDLVEIIRAKSRPDEMTYLHRTQSHSRLRQALLGLGSSSGGDPGGTSRRPMKNTKIEDP
jgi:hypothetical protein